MSPDSQRPWWRSIQWLDVALVVLAVVILLMLTESLWLPYTPVGRLR